MEICDLMRLYVLTMGLLGTNRMDIHVVTDLEEPKGLHLYDKH